MPGEAQVGFNGGLVLGCNGRGDVYVPKSVVLRRPDDNTAAVSGLDRRAEVVVVVIGDGVLACAVLGLDEKGGGGEFAVWPWAVLGGDGWRCGGCYVLPLTLALSHGEKGIDGLAGFGNQAFVAVQVITALGLA